MMQPSDDPPKKKKKKKQKGASPTSTLPRRFHRRAEDVSSSPSIWLISFTDVMALMLTFFVLMFAMSNPKQEDWEKLTQNIQESFQSFEGKIENRGTEDAINIEKINFSEALNLSYLRLLMEKLIEQSPSLEAVTITENPDSLALSFPEDILFDAGEARVKDNAMRALFTLANALERIKNRIEIEGHTDPRPISSESFPSNWELSLMRAVNVASVLENVGYKRPVTIRGAGSSRYDDLPDAMDQEQKFTLSRRIDIVIMEDDGRRKKLFDIGLPRLP